MDWKECVERKLVQRKTKDKELSKSLLKIAVERFNFFSSKEYSIFTLEDIYESIIELCHALLSLEGLKTVSHECAVEFLRRGYLTDYEVELIHKLRKRRHGIKYYGQILKRETLIRNVESGKALFSKLKSILEETNGMTWVHIP